MTRLWPQGLALHVVAPDGLTPQSLVWRGRTHRVVQIVARVRLDERWWRGRVWREEIQLLTHDGLLLLIAHDLTHDTWLLLRLYD